MVPALPADLCLPPAPSGPPWQVSRFDLPPAGPYVLPAPQRANECQGRGGKMRANSFPFHSAGLPRGGPTHPGAPQSAMWTVQTGWSTVQLEHQDSLLEREAWGPHSSLLALPLTDSDRHRLLLAPGEFPKGGGGTCLGSRSDKLDLGFSKMALSISLYVHLLLLP